MSDLENKQRAEVMARCLEDPTLFLRTFLPHWFSKKISWAHRGMLAILMRQTDFLLNFGPEVWPDGKTYHWTMHELKKIMRHFVWRETPQSPPVYLFHLIEKEDGTYHIDLHLAPNAQIVWPRGFGKTSIINASNIIKTVYKLRKFIVYVSETATHANMQIANIKKELTSNERLIAVFGKQKPERTDEEVWRQDFFETTGGVAFTGRGRGGQVRGLLHGAIRPDDIILDDVEDKESVSTPEQRQKTLTWFYADVVPATNQITKEGSILMIGTLLHREALIPKVLGDPEWVSVVFGALDPEGDPLWAEYMTQVDIDRRKRSFARVGKLAEFYMEFMSLMTVNEAAIFKGPFPIKLMHRSEFVAVALAQDPAISEDKDADFCTFGAVGITEHGRYHILEVYGEKGMHPRAQIDKFFEMKLRWDTTHQGIEAVAYQKALIHLTKEEMFRKSRTMGSKAYFEITPILHGKQGKFPRVEGMLAPRYSAGYISHQQVFPELEQQLLEWPNDKLDYPDVVAMAITLLDPYAALSFEPTEEEEEKWKALSHVDPLARDHYEPLDHEYWNAP